MKLNTLQKAQFIGEYWDYTTEQDPVNGILEATYFQDGQVNGILQTEGQTGEIAFYCAIQLRRDAQVRNLRDHGGNLVYTDASGDSFILYVTQFEPVFNVWSKVDGYRHVLQRG